MVIMTAAVLTTGCGATVTPYLTPESVAIVNPPGLPWIVEARDTARAVFITIFEGVFGAW